MYTFKTFEYKLLTKTNMKNLVTMFNQGSGV